MDVPHPHVVNWPVESTYHALRYPAPQEMIGFWEAGAADRFPRSLPQSTIDPNSVSPTESRGPKCHNLNLVEVGRASLAVPDVEKLRAELVMDVSVLSAF